MSDTEYNNLDDNDLTGIEIDATTALINEQLNEQIEQSTTEQINVVMEQLITNVLKSQSQEIILRQTPIHFGLHNNNYNWYLLKLLDPDTLSRLNLHWYFVDVLADILNWDILSSKPIPGHIFVKYKNKIIWDVFLSNGHPKELNYLIKLPDILEKHKALFKKNNIKKLYFNTQFIR